MHNRNNMSGGRNRARWVTGAVAGLYALYIMLLLFSRVPYIAQMTIDERVNNMEEQYDHVISFPQDGQATHYTVYRYDTDYIGRIYTTYTTSSHTLDVETQNIKRLSIDTRSMYEDESDNILKMNNAEDSNYYKSYFIERDEFNIHITSDYGIAQLEFMDVPMPYIVLVDGEEWWQSGVNYTFNGKGVVLTHVPAGRTDVTLLFKTLPDKTPPQAIIDADPERSIVGRPILFDATRSSDPDGQIVEYFWDMGDGTHAIGPTIKYAYFKIGVYHVILTVRDDDMNIGRADKTVVILPSTGAPAIIDTIPDQAIPEDTPFWPIDLTPYESDSEDTNVDLIWYVSDHNESLFMVSGQYSANDELTFIPRSNKFGSCLTTFWLEDSDGNRAFQEVWINITPVNDPPRVLLVPTLFVHYDFNYVFNYSQYIIDIDNQPSQLDISVSHKEYTSVDGLEVTYNFPESMVDSQLEVELEVCDPESCVSFVQTINITSEWPPSLIKPLPDVSFNEDSAAIGVIDLDDYFEDRDNDSLFFSYGFNNVDVQINADNTVDIYAPRDWNGVDLVTFRASDQSGAIKEDIIKVTVIPVNDPPYISDIPDLFIRYNQDYHFDLSQYIWDVDTPDDELLIWTSDPENIQIGYSQKFIMTLNYSAEYNNWVIPIVLSVSDNDATTNYVFEIQVSDNAPPTLVKALPEAVFKEDQRILNFIDLNDYFEDDDAWSKGEKISFIVASDNIFANITLNSLLDLSAEPNWFGTENITIKAKDESNSFVESVMKVTVLPINDPPAIKPLPEVSGRKGEFLVINLEQYISDVDNSFEELTITSDHPAVIVKGSILQVNFLDDMPKTIDITVSDGSLGEVTTLQITMEDEKDGNKSDIFRTYLYVAIIVILIILLTIGVVMYVSYIGKYNITEIFLIHKRGSLIHYTAIRDGKPKTEDMGLALCENIAVSAMFTAIQEFAKDSFIDRDTMTSNTSDGTERKGIRQLTIGNSNIIIRDGDDIFRTYLYVAIIVILIILLTIGVVMYVSYIGKYNITEIFLIHKRGSLIHYTAIRDGKPKTEDMGLALCENIAVSAMFTAIQEFAKDSFIDRDTMTSNTSDGTERKGIRQLTIGNSNIIIRDGDNIYMAMVYNGNLGKYMPGRVQKTVDTIENEYAHIVPNWSGAIRDFEGVGDIIETLL